MHVGNLTAEDTIKPCRGGDINLVTTATNREPEYIVKDSSTKGISPAMGGEPEGSRLKISRGYTVQGLVQPRSGQILADLDLDLGPIGLDWGQTRSKLGLKGKMVYFSQLMA